MWALRRDEHEKSKAEEEAERKAAAAAKKEREAEAAPTGLSEAVELSLLDLFDAGACFHVQLQICSDSLALSLARAISLFLPLPHSLSVPLFRSPFLSLFLSPVSLSNSVSLSCWRLRPRGCRRLRS